MTDQLKSEFWNRIAKAGPGMLEAGDAGPAPMTHQADPGDRALWFITARDTALAGAAAGPAVPARYIVASEGANLYAGIDGRLRQVDDRAKLDEFWTAFASAWFEDGKHDDDVRLLRFDPTRAEVWASDGTAAFLYKAAQAKMAGDAVEDAGLHGQITF